MAASTEQAAAQLSSDVQLLLQPELLSLDSMRRILREKRVGTGAGDSRERLTELYLRHVLPRPQRTVPDRRWGKKMEEVRGRTTPAGHGPHSTDAANLKREAAGSVGTVCYPLIQGERCNGVSRGEEKDPSCDLALTSDLYTHEPDAAQTLRDRPLPSTVSPTLRDRPLPSTVSPTLRDRPLPSPPWCLPP
ncbi:Ashwin [Liparis tanakae]|uniref:Ashwin n=1 Tax=Liparis tanakae TaxID=230148 RepID=A0A4Z2ERM7_9TELE|nr:Ashwin [Liparis tanakae]